MEFWHCKKNTTYNKKAGWSSLIYIFLEAISFISFFKKDQIANLDPDHEHTDYKLITNWLQTDCKLIANWLQTDYK